MDATDLITLSPAQFAAVIALFLPGFVSLRVDRLIHPNTDKPAGDNVIEILGYSMLNAGVFSWAIVIAAHTLSSSRPNYFALAVLGALICVIGPAVWPLLFRALQKALARRSLAISPHRTAWDDYFSRKQPCWIVVHLADGSSVGGYFGEDSVASVGSEAGHLYLEEIWQLGASGEFLNAVPESKGAIFRPGDYIWIEMRRDD